MTDPVPRRAVLIAALGAIAASAIVGTSLAQSSRLTFAQWVERFRPRARDRGVSEATYNRVMGEIKPDTAVYALQRSQAEFREPMWQYVNRRVSDWRIITGKDRAVQLAALIERVEKQYGVDRYLMLGLWGMESAFGDVVVNRKYMRPVISALEKISIRPSHRRAK